MKRISLASVFFAAALSSCVVNVDEQSVDKSATFNASGMSSLAFDGGNLSRKLVINGGTSDTLTAFARASVWGSSADAAQRIAEGMKLVWTGTTEGRLTVDYPGTEREFVRVDDITVGAPSRLNLNIDLSSTDLDIRDMTGNVTVDVSSGDLNIATTGRVNIESSSGDVDVRTGRGGSIDVSSGDIRVDVTDNDFQDLEINSSSGDVVINLLNGMGLDLELETSSGTIAVNYGGFATIDHEGYVSVRVNGGGRKVRVEASSGDIQIGKL